MKFNSADYREARLQIIGSFCDLHKRSIDCYDEFLQEFNKVVDDGKYSEDWIESLMHGITCIKEYIRDMNILLRKRDLMKEIVFKKEKIKQLDCLITDFLETQDILKQKHEQMKIEVDNIIKILISS